MAADQKGDDRPDRQIGDETRLAKQEQDHRHNWNGNERGIENPFDYPADNGGPLLARSSAYRPDPHPAVIGKSPMALDARASLFVILLGL